MKKTFLSIIACIVFFYSGSAQNDSIDSRPEFVINNGLSGPLKYFAVNHFGDIVATLSETGLVQAWDVALRAPLMSNQIIGNAWGLAISPEGNYVAVLRPDGIVMHKDSLNKNYLKVPAIYRTNEDSIVILQTLHIDIYSTKAGLQAFRTIDITRHLFNQGNWPYNRLFEYGVLTFEDINIRFTGETEVEYIDLMCAYRYNFNTDVFRLNIQPWHEPDKEPLLGLLGDSSTWNPIYFTRLRNSGDKPRRNVHRHLYSDNGRFTALTFSIQSNNSKSIEVWDISERKKVTDLPENILPNDFEFYDVLSIDNNGRYLTYKAKDKEKPNLQDTNIDPMDIIVNPKKFKEEFNKMQGYAKILVMDLSTHEVVNSASFFRISELKAGLDGGFFQICNQLLMGVESSDKKGIANIPNIIDLSGKPDDPNVNNIIYWHNYLTGQTDTFHYSGGEVKAISYNELTQSAWIMEKSDIVRILLGSNDVQLPFKQVQPSMLSANIDDFFLNIASTDGFVRIHMPTGQITDLTPLTEIGSAAYSTDGLRKVASKRGSLISINSTEVLHHKNKYIIPKIVYDQNRKKFYYIESGESGLSDGSCRLYEYENSTKNPIKIKLKPRYCISKKVLHTMGRSDAEINWVDYCSVDFTDSTFQANGLAVSIDGRWLAINTTAEIRGGLLDLIKAGLSGSDESFLNIIKPGSLFVFKKQEGNWIQQWVLEPNMMSYDFTNEINITFSPDSRYLAASTDNDKVKVWSLETGKQIKEYRLDLERGYIFSSKQKDINLSPQTPIQAAKGRKENDLIRGITFSPDGEKLAFAAKDLGIVIRFNPDDDSDFYAPIVSNYFIKKGYITCQSFNESGTIVLSGTSEGTLEAWGKKSNKFVVTLMARASTEALAIIDSNGYYMANKRSLTNCYFKEEGKLFSLGSANEYLNRPDTVLQALWPLYINETTYGDTSIILAFKEIHNKRGNFYRNKSFVNIDNKRSLLQKKWTSAPVRCAFSPNGIVKRLMIKVNGVPIWGKYGKTLTHKESVKGFVEVWVDLLPGNNSIQVSCFDEKDLESHEDQIILIGEAPAENSKPNLYLISICVDKYKDETLPDLAYSVKDGNDFTSLLENANGFYEYVFCEKFFNTTVDTSILKKIKSNLKNARIQDHIILFLSGHGFLDKKNASFWFPLPNTNFDSLNTTALRYEQLNWLFEDLTARRKAIFIDACHSGKLFDNRISMSNERVSVIPEKIQKGKKSRRKKVKGIPTGESISLSSTALMEDYFTELNNSTGTLVFAATTGDSKAQENREWANGAFTLGLIKALKESPEKTDTNQDGEISIFEWFSSSRKIVYSLTGGSQRPSVKQDSPWADFRIR